MGKLSTKSTSIQAIIAGYALSAIGVAAVARAAEGAEHGKNHPCKAIEAACVAAGFKKGDHKDKKGLWVDCVKPIMDGSTVAGVTVPADAVAACKEKKAEHHK
ncbi:MAG: hypothetical protein WCO71_06220 [Pseudomonadota bacterium]